LLSELLDHRSLSQVRNPPELAVQLPYPPFDEHAENGCDENDAKARKEEGIDSDGVERWGKIWRNVWLYRAILHDERLIEEDILDGIQRVFLQETDCLDEKGRKERGEYCGLVSE